MLNCQGDYDTALLCQHPSLSTHIRRDHLHSSAPPPSLHLSTHPRRASKVHNVGRPSLPSIPLLICRRRSLPPKVPTLIGLPGHDRIVRRVRTGSEIDGRLVFEQVLVVLDRGFQNIDSFHAPELEGISVPARSITHRRRLRHMDITDA